MILSQLKLPRLIQNDAENRFCNDFKEKLWPAARAGRPTALLAMVERTSTPGSNPKVMVRRAHSTKDYESLRKTIFRPSYEKTTGAYGPVAPKEARSRP